MWLVFCLIGTTVEENLFSLFLYVHSTFYVLKLFRNCFYHWSVVNFLYPSMDLCNGTIRSLFYVFRSSGEKEVTLPSGTALEIAGKLVIQVCAW